MDTTERSSTRVLLAFWRGLTQPSWAAIIISLFVAAATLVFLTKVINEDFLMRHGDLFLECRDDPSVTSTITILKLRREPLTAPLVILVGDNQSQGFAQARDSLSTMAIRDNEFRVVDLTTAGQSFWETAALLDRVPRNAKGVVILDVSATRFQLSSSLIEDLANRAPFGFRSRAFDSEVMRVGLPPRSLHGNYFLDNQSYLIPRIGIAIRNLLMDVSDNCLSAERSRERNDQNFATNLAVLERAIGRLTQQTRLDCLLVSPSKEVSSFIASRSSSIEIALVRLTQSEPIFWNRNLPSQTPRSMANWIELRLANMQP